MFIFFFSICKDPCDLATMPQNVKDFIVDVRSLGHLERLKEDCLEKKVYQSRSVAQLAGLGIAGKTNEKRMSGNK